MCLEAALFRLVLVYELGKNGWAGLGVGEQQAHCRSRPCRAWPPSDQQPLYPLKPSAWPPGLMGPSFWGLHPDLGHSPTLADHQAWFFAS